MDEPLVVVQEPMNGADLYRKLAAPKAIRYFLRREGRSQ
jgi:hypothetical protein